MNLNRKDFLSAFDAVAHLASRRTTAAVLNCVKLEAKDGILTVTATDGDTFAAAKCACDAPLDPTCVSAYALGGLAKTPSETIEIKRSENRLWVTTGGTAKLGIVDPKEFPSFPNGKQKALALSTTDLADCIEGVAWGADAKDDHGQFWRTLIWVKATDKSLECAGCNQNKLGYVNRPLISVPCEFSLPSNAVRDLITALRSPESMITESDTWVTAKSASLNVAVKKAQLKYPNVYHVLNQERVDVGVIETGPIIDALSTINTLAQNELHAAVSFSFDGTNATMEWNGQSHSYKTQVPFAAQVNPFRVDSKLMLATIKSTNADKVGAKIGSNGIELVSGDFRSLTAFLSKPSTASSTK